MKEINPEIFNRGVRSVSRTKQCPICTKTYEARHATKDEAFVTHDMESREQWLSGICSNKCFDEAVPDMEEGE